MTRSSFGVAVASLVLAVAASSVLVAPMMSASASTVAAAAPVAAPAEASVKKLALNKQGRPGFTVTTNRQVWILVQKPGTEIQFGDGVRQSTGSKTWRLRPVKLGQARTYLVMVISKRTGQKLASQRYVWRNYQRQAANVRNRYAVGKSDVYAEIHPRKGGKLAVRSVVALGKRANGSTYRVKMIHAYTDERTGTRVYVATVCRGNRISQVVSHTAYVRLRNSMVVQLAG